MSYGPKAPSTVMSAADIDVNQVSTTRVQKAIFAASLALVTHEYAITFKHEISHIWKRKLSITSAFLVCTRYTMLLGPLTQILLEFHATRSYRRYQVLTVVVYNLGMVQIAGLSALRAYALSDRNWYISTLVMVLGALIPVITNILASVTTPPGALQSLFASCILIGHASLVVEQLYGYLCCFSIIAAELLVIVVTWRKTLSQIRMAKHLGMERLPLATCLVRDGSLYFIAMVSVNILGAASEISSAPIIPEMMMIAQYLIALIASRLIMNLRAIDRVNAISRPLQTLSAVQFRVPQDDAEAGASRATEETLIGSWADSDDEDDGF